MTATIVEIFDELRESNSGTFWHSLIEEYDDHDRASEECARGGIPFDPDPAQVPLFVWAGGAR